MSNPEYDFNLGEYVGTCRRSGCGKTFSGHGNLRYCSGLCYQQEKYNNKKIKDAKRFEHHGAASQYQSNADLLEGILKKRKTEVTRVSADYLNDLGFEFSSPFEAFEGIINGYEIKKFGNTLLLKDSKEHSYIVMDDGTSYHVNRRLRHILSRKNDEVKPV